MMARVSVANSLFNNESNLASSSGVGNHPIRVSAEVALMTASVSEQPRTCTKAGMAL